MRKLLTTTLATGLLLSPITSTASAVGEERATGSTNEIKQEVKSNLDMKKINKKTSKVKKHLTDKERNTIINEFEYADSVTKEELNDLSDVTLQLLSEENGEIVSVEKVSSYNLNSPKEGEFTTYTMPNEHFEMSVIGLQVGENTYKFHAEGDWKVNPNYEFTDVIALAWTDNFTLEDDLAFTLEDMGKGYLEPDYTGLTRNKVDGEAGVGYDVDLVLGEDEEEVVLQALVTKPNTSGRANLVGEYGHLELRPSDITLGFSLGAQPSVSMSAGIGTNLEKASPAYDAFDY
ncbi:MAG: hypothetical protein ACQET6_07585 [Bacillota bacterium]